MNEHGISHQQHCKRPDPTQTSQLLRCALAAVVCKKEEVVALASRVAA